MNSGVLIDLVDRCLSNELVQGKTSVSAVRSNSEQMKKYKWSWVKTASITSALHLHVLWDHSWTDIENELKRNETKCEEHHSEQWKLSDLKRESEVMPGLSLAID